MTESLHISEWDTPKSRNFAELGDPVLFAEVLEVAQKEGKISVNKLISESEGLRSRLRRLWVVDKPTRTTINGILSAMKHFGWLKEEGPLYILTDLGFEAFIISKNEKLFRRELAQKMHERYIVPGWIISRLHKLNPSGQGEIVLPSPLKDWQPGQRPWEQSDWSTELEFQLMRSVEKARKSFPGSFPVEDAIWTNNVRKNWEELASGERRRVAKPPKEHQPQGDKPRVSTYAQRGRLYQAMREASIDLLFSSYFPVTSGERITVRTPDFNSDKHPIPPRAFGAWCPRLDALELAFYTDSHPSIAGRLIFPCGIFRDKATTPPFEPLHRIENPYGQMLFLYQPIWSNIKDQFTEVLWETYRRVSQKVGALYISLLDVRDEVCRQLKLSSILFDTYINSAYREAVQESISIGKKSLSISLESDIRPEQQTGYGLLRRPVYIDTVPHSLIAMRL